ncbi:FosX/FosE/FosI family fosfomycin resistance hydrolase [Shinella sumterensis]|uniref:FosX/FosE/FosI family fosfomycin resistance hydrolase n=1 Tax=Shinella sumterensis TaxID=1967501 RepID=A0AA50H8L2_9HYPH|nr:FosX/FosE/FosI family fosfomycin resistance hydrolase [Shinella sumterensis]WLR99287.1 FosX/FosE/FosI family fosfomycin resistance hydrolase [Shinella sumterensis]
MIEGLSHITFIVRDLDRMTDILQGVFDAKQVYASGKRQFSLSPERFFVIGGLWIAIMEGEPLCERTYNHIAFKVPDDTLDLYRERIERLGLDVRPPRPRVEGEGRSLYFHDDDNHLFELHSGTLDERLASYSRLETMSK